MAPKIDVAPSDGIKKALLAAKTIAYSAGPSWVHIERLIANWGLSDHKGAGPTEAARALLKFLTDPEAAAIIRKTGMEPG